MLRQSAAAAPALIGASRALTAAAAAAAAAAQPRRGAARISTSAAQDKRGADEVFQFEEHCKGERVESAAARETKEQLRRSDFGAPRHAQQTAGAGAAAGSQQHSAGGVHAATAAAARDTEERSADDAAQELVEKGSKRMLQSDEGREELSQGSFNLDQTAQRVAEEGAKDASPEAAARSRKDEDVAGAVKSRVTAGSQAG